jgi:hypothetical protein
MNLAARLAMSFSWAAELRSDRYLSELAMRLWRSHRAIWTRLSPAWAIWEALVCLMSCGLRGPARPAFLATLWKARHALSFVKCPVLGMRLEGKRNSFSACSGFAALYFSHAFSFFSICSGRS